MVWFDSCGLFLESKPDLLQKITACDQVIAALQTVMIRAASGEDIGEYQLNDGQTIIRVVSRGIEGITKSLQAMRILRQDYINQHNGRVFRALDGKNFRNKYGNQF